MVETMVFTYGMLASFVLSGASRNRKLARPNPRMLEYAGFVLCGTSGGLAVLLAGMALTGQVTI